MMGIFNIAVLTLVILCSIPILVLFVECMFAFVSRLTKRSECEEGSPRISILVPAHNEELVLSATLKVLLAEITDDVDLRVIADNCTDSTVGIARSLGVQVLERKSEDEKGKGYALDFGLRSLAEAPPDVVVVIDADCHVEPGSIQKISRMAMSMNRPVQARYLMTTPPNSSPKNSVSAFAFLVKNYIRPFGLTKMGMPCGMTGTGMAFPWDVIQQISLASGSIVEDLQLGVDLAISGSSPQFCYEAIVVGELPKQHADATGQRIRWEHGHLQMIRTQAWRMFSSAFKQRRLELFVLALDLCIPPLSLLVMLWSIVLVISGVSAYFTGATLPLIIAGVDGILLAAAIFCSWLRFGRNTVSLFTLLRIPAYILWKIPIYITYLFRPQKEWVRTSRESA